MFFSPLRSESLHDIITRKKAALIVRDLEARVTLTVAVVVVVVERGLGHWGLFHLLLALSGVSIRARFESLIRI